MGAKASSPLSCFNSSSLILSPQQLFQTPQKRKRRTVVINARTGMLRRDAADKKIVAKGETVPAATLSTVAAVIKDAEMLTLYYGADVTEDEAAEMSEKLQEKYPDLEVAAYYGGQPHYYYIISAE